MAVVAPSTNHVLILSPNSFEWPPLNEQYESTLQESIAVRDVTYDHTNSEYSGDVLTLQTFIRGKVEPQKSCSDNDRGYEGNVDANTDVTSTSSLVTETNSSDAFDEYSESVATIQDLANELALEQVEGLDSSDCLHSSPIYLDDVSVLQTPCDLEMNKHAPKHKNGETVENTCIKKKKHLKKVRRKSSRKWKPYHSAELGFHISLTSYFVHETDNVDEDTCEGDAPNVGPVENDSADKDSCEGRVTRAEPVEQNSDDNDTCKCEVAQADSVDESSHEVSSDGTAQDDINFFLDLGIDVVNYNNHNDVQDWDGVYLSAPSEYAYSHVVDNKRSSHPKSKSTKKLPPARNSQTTATPKTNGLCQPETIHTFPVSSFEFSKIKKSDKYKLFELECSSAKRMYIRRDRHRKKEKAHKAVKSKNCRSVLNNIGRKTMYMHHRLIKMHRLDLDFRGSTKSCRIPPMPKTTVAADVAKVIFRADRKLPATDRPVPPVQCLNHALHETNVTGIEGNLANFLISLQHRDLTPEDYDMLLQLDDSIKPKTISENVLQRLRTEKIGPNGPEQGAGDWEPLCTICMESYITGQERKFLPCGHDFHTECIDKWLKNSSMNCPLDGLPVDAS